MIFKPIIDRILEQSKSYEIVDIYNASFDWYSNSHNTHSGYLCMLCLDVLIKHASWLDKIKFKRMYNILKKELPEPTEQYQSQMVEYLHGIK